MAGSVQANVVTPKNVMVFSFVGARLGMDPRPPRPSLPWPKRPARPCPISRLGSKPQIQKGPRLSFFILISFLSCTRFLLRKLYRTDDDEVKKKHNRGPSAELLFIYGIGISEAETTPIAKRPRATPVFSTDRSSRPPRPGVDSPNMRKNIVGFAIITLVLLAFAVHHVWILITLLFVDGHEDKILRAELPAPGSHAIDEQRQVIPKIIHQTYINESLPAHWIEPQKSCLDLHPDYEYIVGTPHGASSFGSTRNDN